MLGSCWIGVYWFIIDLSGSDGMRFFQVQSDSFKTVTNYVHCSVLACVCILDLYQSYQNPQCLKINFPTSWTKVSYYSHVLLDSRIIFPIQIGRTELFSSSIKTATGSGTDSLHSSSEHRVNIELRHRAECDHSFFWTLGFPQCDGQQWPLIMWRDTLSQAHCQDIITLTYSDLTIITSPGAGRGAVTSLPWLHQTETELLELRR